MSDRIASKIRKVVRNPKVVMKLTTRKVKEKLLWNYYYSSLREPKARITVPLKPSIDAITDKLRNAGVHVKNLPIDVADYYSYLEKANYEHFPDYYGGGTARNFPEKSLEHYIAAKLLQFSKDDVYIDVASENSPTVEIYQKLYGCSTYRQDILFDKGVNGNTIGGDASNMPVQDGFATKMALHCSFEHFEQEADTRFVWEARRVLRNGGKLCIVPLYLFDTYGILTDPAVLPKGGIFFDPDAVLFCRKGWGERHGRFYDVPHLVSRVIKETDLKFTIYVVQNEDEVDPTCYVKFIAVFEKD